LKKAQTSQQQQQQQQLENKVGIGRRVNGISHPSAPYTSFYFYPHLINRSLL